MSDHLVRPGQLSGHLVPPPSKSDAHRAMICAALAGDGSLVKGLPEHLSQDLQATRSCLAALRAGEKVLDCHESGTTLRLLIPVAAAFGADVTFTGTGRLPQRPLLDYQAILSGHGVTLGFPEQGSLPLHLSGKLQPGCYAVPGHVSSQYLSGLLLALPLLDDDSEITLTSPLESAPYVDMTMQTLLAFGVETTSQDGVYKIPGRQHFQPVPYKVEKDFSQAAFWLTANYLGSRVRVENLPEHSAQGDRAILSLLADFARGLNHYVIDAAHIPDLVPILAVAASLTPAAETRIIHAGRLRLKESDRLAVTCSVLQAIGADIEQVEDSLTIRGAKALPGEARPLLQGGTADSYGDHRIAMALAIAALSTREGVTILGSDAVRKSYPDFFAELIRLGGDCHELNVG
jgi:3-phosphoshikimate 1-carboxyvinyltransferase